ncbi:MAG: hypothetical protein V1708_03205 [Candidatus Micrarchaeota archaeon]
MAVAVLHAASIFTFFDDFSFIIQILTFTYILFQLYITFRDSQILFGLASIVAAYFTVLNPLPTTVLVVFFAAFIMMGTHLQMLIQFGVYPLLRIFGVELEHAEMAEQQHMQKIEKKLMEGHELDDSEVQFLEKHQQKQAAYQKNIQYYMRPQQ